MRMVAIYIIFKIFLNSPASKAVGYNPMKHSVVQNIFNRIPKMTVFRFVPFKFPDHNCAGVSWDKLASDPSEKILHYLFRLRDFSGASRWRFETYFWLPGTFRRGSKRMFTFEDDAENQTFGDPSKRALFYLSFKSNARIRLRVQVLKFCYRNIDKTILSIYISDFIHKVDHNHGSVLWEISESSIISSYVW